MRTNESEEMYLETILLLKKRKQNVHSVDIVQELDYAKSSVSRAVNLLRKNGYIGIEPDGELKLTASGQKKAEAIYERHCILSKILMTIGADAETATENACRIEHVISDEMFAICKDFVQKSK